MHSNGKTNEFRLYFADCPEKRRHDFNQDRLLEQGRYFGGLSEAQMTQIGQQAQALTQHLLTTQPFTLYTKWQRVYNSSRHYAFVVFADGEDLSAKLVRAGLARIHTSGTTLPDGRSTAQYQAALRQMEAAARSEKSRSLGFAPLTLWQQHHFRAHHCIPLIPNGEEPGVRVGRRFRGGDDIALDGGRPRSSTFASSAGRCRWCS